MTWEKKNHPTLTRELYWYVINDGVASNLPVVMTCRLPLEGNESLVELMGVDTVEPALWYDPRPHRDTGRGQLPKNVTR